MAERPFRSLEELHGARLDEFRKMYHPELRIAAALEYCAEHKLNAPPWLIDQSASFSCSALRGKKSKKRGRASGPLARPRQDWIDYARWARACEIRENQQSIREEVKRLRVLKAPPRLLTDYEKMRSWVGKSWARAFECASVLFRGTDARARSGGIKKSYLKVQRRLKDPEQRMRYHLLDDRLLRKLGIELNLQPIRGNKIVPFWGLELE
jgi:hypothetical protein